MTFSDTSLSAIDCHAHVLAHDRAITSHRHKQPQRSHTPEELLELFDSCGISQGLLTAPSFYLTDNSLLLEALAKSGRFKGTVNLSPDATVEQMIALRSQGICGARLNWFKKSALPEIKGYQDFMARLKEADLHLELFVEGQYLPKILPTIGRVGVKLVLDHFGSPDPVAGVNSDGFKLMLRAMDAGQAWVKLSAPYRLQGEDFEKLGKTYAQAMVRSAGPERLVWASDWPWTAHEEGMSYRCCLAWLDEWIPDAADRQVILCDTPRALFGFI